jgi:ankyrin repeat protein
VVVLYVVVLYLALAVLARVASRPEAFTAGPVPSLFIAARDGRINDIKSLVAHGHEVNARDASGATPLIEAAKSGQVAAARELIALHADVNLADRLGYTALMWAAFLGHDGALQELLKASARVDVKNAKGATALMLAADKGHASAAQALLNAGAAVDARDGDMATALLWAATHGHTDMAKLLLDHQASIDPPESYGRTPLLAAAFHGHDQLAQLLIDRGADANYDHHSHWTPGLALGCHAAFLKQYERAIPLLKQGLEGRGGQRRLKQWSNRQFDQPWPITAGQAQYEIPYPAAALWVLLGECYRETKKWDEAKRAFMSALAAFPRDGDRVLLYQKEPLLVPALKSPPDGDGFVVYPRQTRPTPWTHETYEISRSQTEQLAQNPQGAVTLSFTGESRTPTGTTARERDLQANGILH